MESFYDLCNDACSTYNRIKTISFLCNNKFDTWEPFGQFNSILFWISHSIHINLKHFHTSKLPFIVVLIWVPVAQDPESSNTGWMLKLLFTNVSGLARYTIFIFTFAFFFPFSTSTIQIVRTIEH